MTLIKEMLDNLERRNGSDPEKPQQTESGERKRKRMSRPKKHRNILTQRFWLGSLVTGSSFLVLIGAFFIIYNNLTSKSLTTQRFASGNATATSAAPNHANKLEYRTVTSNSVHQMYLSAINDLNEGKVDEAIAELKVIIKEDPKFTPAKQTYDAIQSRYGVNVTK